MEEDRINPALLEISGTVIHFNKGAAFLQFREEGEGGGGTCLFRPNRLLVNGRRLTTSQLRTVESIGQFLALGDTLSGLVTPRHGARPYVLNADSKVPSQSNGLTRRTSELVQHFRLYGEVRCCLT
jgi:hypothetical protein